MYGCIPSRDRSHMEPLDNNDRLSRLPDDVLLSVLERLDNAKSAARAGVLSKRWKHLPWLLTELNIDITAIAQAKSNVPGAMAAFAKATQSFLATSSTSDEKVWTIKNLRMVFFLMKKYTSNIVLLLRDAIKKGRVKHLELELKVDVEDEYESSEFHTRYLMSFGYIVLSSVKKLVLNNLQFHESELNHLLQKCKQLVNLEMVNCDCGDGVPYKIDAPESQIECLNFILCDFGRIELLRLPKLKELNCQQWGETSVPLYLGSLPSLKKLILGNLVYIWMRNFTLGEIGLANAPNLEDLVLGFFQDRIWVQEEPVQRLRRSLSMLKSLTLDSVFVGCDLSWSMLLLEAAPILEVLVITVREIPNDEDRFDEVVEKPKSISWNISSFKHYHLEKLMLLGVQEEDEPWGFVELVMARAVRLVHVVFSDGYDKIICENDTVKTAHLELFGEDGNKRTVRVDRIRKAGSPH